MTTAEKPSAGLAAWFDERAPGLKRLYRKHMSEYWVPTNLNLWYYLGVLNLVLLGNQLFTGIFLAMNYKTSAKDAFDSVEYIMRDVPWGWLIRYMHSTGASLFFVSVYLHMFRGIMYGSFKKPREIVWILGTLIFLSLMTEAFLGYVLPWGNMSFWAAKVIISLFGTIPYVGDSLVQWLMGDYLPADATLNRFFALHVIAIPLALILLVTLHIFALHEVGSNNPEGIDIKHGPKGNRWSADGPADAMPFHPYDTVKDFFVVGAFLTAAAFIVFFAPMFGGWFLEHDNFIPANNLATPTHIRPSWYFTPFYAILRMIPSFGGTALWGMLAMFGAILLLPALPWIDRGTVRSVRHRGRGFRVALAIFAVSFLGLGLVGAGGTAELFGTWFPHADVTVLDNTFGRLMVLGYFGFFAFLWVYTRFGIEKTRPVPERVPPQ
ncbi:cytochrome b [Luteibacter yeojuensis]|uniref:Cytochrome b n=1 Tax=Luteibacter yeojuensis TaxID=345309 RepID=A0A7X5TPH2_9GAMM|nr:cytochrome bc complex cytochrome b subunit [Luteibacter yeojuensis]NID14719.1 cytochrome bc complex cytochrome b subunit [Luteibacter yeojuensis]